jgi:threonine dehydratase
MAGLACGEPNPIAWEILKDRADYFAICPDFVGAMGMRVYGIPLRGDPSVISGESGAVTLGALMYIMQHAGARVSRAAWAGIRFTGAIDQFGGQHIPRRFPLRGVGRRHSSSGRVQDVLTPLAGI